MEPERKYTPETEECSHTGHRERMRNRYRIHGLDNFQTHEVLEMLLYRSMPQCNTNPAAHALLDECETLEAVLEGKTAVFGVGDKTLSMLRETRDGLECCLQNALRMTERIGKSQFYTAAVWNLRRNPAGIFVMICRNGVFQEMETVTDASPASVFRALQPELTDMEEYHMAFMGREEDACFLREPDGKNRPGMLLLLSPRWTPQWL